MCRFAPRLEITTINTVEKMSRVCELTGKKAMVGNNVSHALNRTKRKFDANLMTKRFFIPEEDKWITLKVSASALKNINKKGISAVIKEARANGFLTK
jgi:large subunit ribosomal protein L28